jgi:hypothetical protein
VVQTDAEIVEAVIGRLEVEKATWTVPNVVQVTWQVMDRDLATTVEDDEARAQGIVAAVLGHDEVLKLTPSLDLDLPAHLVRADGEPVYKVHLTDRYATRSAFNEEEYLVARCQSTTITPVSGARVKEALAATGGVGLSDDQAAAVRGVLTSAGDVNVVVGPAGTGKTTTMASSSTPGRRKEATSLAWLCPRLPPTSSHRRRAPGRRISPSSCMRLAAATPTVSLSTPPAGRCGRASWSSWMKPA